MIVIGDIGGTKTRLSTIDRDSFTEPIIFDTPKDFNEGISRISSEVKRMKELFGVPDAFIFGLPGIFNSKDGTLFRAPNLPLWEGKDISESLKGEFPGVKVILKNDSALVALGEAHFGAGKDFPIVAYITVSTGVGGARVVYGQLDPAAYNFEPGHQFIESGNHDLESLVSGTAIEKKYHKKPFMIEDKEVWSDIAETLSRGIVNTCLHWSPSVFVLGGSMFKEVGISVDEVREFSERSLKKIYPNMPEFRHSKLGDLGGLYGALAIAKQELI